MKNNNEKIELLRRMKAALLAGTMSMSLVGLSGCAKNAPCDIPGRHAHYYVSDDDLGRYIISEKEYISKLNRTDDYILIDKTDADMFNYINKMGLYKIPSSLALYCSYSFLKVMLDTIVFLQALFDHFNFGLPCIKKVICSKPASCTLVICLISDSDILFANRV